MAEIANTPAAAPAPAAEAPSSPVSSGSAPLDAGAMGVDELFSKAEEFFATGEQNAGKNPGIDMHDLVNSINSPMEDSVKKQQEKETAAIQDLANEAGEDEDLPLYRFEGKVGEKAVSMEIKDKADLDKLLTKAVMAQDLYKEHKKVLASMDTYKEKAELLDQIDKLTEENPIEFMNNLVEDLSEEQEEQFADWLLQQADNLRKSKEQRAYEKEIREARRIRQERESEIKRAQALQERQAQVAAETERKQLSAWANTEFQKYSAKLPAEYKEWIDDQIKYTVAKSRQMMDNGEEVTFEDLSRMLSRQLKPVLSRTTPNQVRQEIGRATEEKKKQSLTKLQATAGRVVAPTARNNRLQELAQSGNTSGIFDFFEEMVDNGSLKLTR